MVTFLSTPMVVLYRPCKIDPTETRSPFNAPTPETVTRLECVCVCVCCVHQAGRGCGAAGPVGGAPVVGRLQGHKRRKAAKMVGVVILLFATCWLPIHIFQLWYKYDPYFPRTEVTYVYKILAHALSYANSCVNPIVYSFLGDGFRKGVKKAFPRVFSGGHHPAAVVSGETARSQRGNVGRVVSSSTTIGASETTESGVGAVRGRRAASPRPDHVVLSRQMSLPAAGATSRFHLLTVVEELSL